MRGTVIRPVASELDRRRCGPTSRWSAPAPPASTPRSPPRREGARVVLVSRSPLAESASYWAQGGIAAALADDDSPERHLADTLSGRAAASAGRAPIGCCARSRPSACATSAALGVHFDADRHGALALGLEGGHSQRRVVHAGGSATGRRITRDLSALVAHDPRIEVLERTTAQRAVVPRRPLRRPRGRAPARGAGPRTRLPIAAARARSWPPAARRRCGSARPTRAARSAPGMSLAHARGRRARRPRVRPVPPHGAAARRRARRLPDHRGDPRRGRAAARRRTASASWTSWRRATRWRSPSRRVLARARRTVRLDMRAIDMTHFPNVAAHARARRGSTRAATWCPSRPAAHYTMGGDRHRPRRPLDAARPVRGRRVRLQRAARRQPARLELARRVLRVRPPRRRWRRSTSRARRPTRARRPRRARSGARRRQTRAALWRLAGPRARRRRACASSRGDPFPLARDVARVRPAREESRGAHQRGDFPDTDPALDLHHAVRGADEPSRVRDAGIDRNRSVA